MVNAKTTVKLWNNLKFWNIPNANYSRIIPEIIPEIWNNLNYSRFFELFQIKHEKFWYKYLFFIKRAQKTNFFSFILQFYRCIFYVCMRKALLSFNYHNKTTSWLAGNFFGYRCRIGNTPGPIVAICKEQDTPLGQKTKWQFQRRGFILAIDAGNVPRVAASAGQHSAFAWIA